MELYISGNIKIRDKLEIKLKEKKTIISMFCMFNECLSLISLPDLQMGHY